MKKNECMCIPEYYEFSKVKKDEELRNNKLITQYLTDYNEWQLSDQDFFCKHLYSLFSTDIEDLINKIQKYKAVNANDR